MAVSTDPSEKLLALIAEGEALASKATKGPWQVGHPDKPWGGIESAENMDDWVIYPHEEGEGGRAEDWEFIAAARTFLPAAYAALRVLVDALSRYDGVPDADGSWGSENGIARALETMERGR